jgi:uncharacterized protein (TIGR03083 family)
MTRTDRGATDVTALAPLDHATAMSLFAVELQRSLDLMRSLGPRDWTAQTDCPAWDVRLLYLHVLGACEGGASTRELAHQVRAARAHQKAHGGPQEAALSAVQVADRVHIAPDQLVDRFAAIAPRCVSSRRRLPSLVRRIRLQVDGPVREKWSLGYLVDVIYLRDAWMHRVDAARATAAELVLSPGHDGRIVADVVAEWARRHGQPFALTLTGPAGGVFTSRRPAESAWSRELDAVEFCRIRAGRAPGDGLLRTVVPF